MTEASASGSAFSASNSTNAFTASRDSIFFDRTDAPGDLATGSSRYRWILPPDGHELVGEAIAQSHKIHPVLGRVLAARGWDSGEHLQHFLKPMLSQTNDPFTMHGMKEATDRLAQAVKDREPVLIWGDYDVDGITSTSIMLHLFRLLNVPVDYHIPDRLSDGYGLHIPPMKEHAKRFRLIVTVDSGMTAVKEADWARRNGVDLIITDHHLPGDELPEALAIVNPNHPECTYPDKQLAGVGVAFKFAHGLLKAIGHPPEEAKAFLRDCLDLVAVGTVCDLMPLVGENRALVRAGLKKLASGERVGFKALKVICGFRYDQCLRSKNIGFGLGPRINAAGRTSNPRLAVELLTTDDEAQAFKLAEQLEKLNDERRKIERKIVDEAGEHILQQCDVENDRVIVCGGENWHLGVIGIVASRILDRYNKPTIICAIGEDGMAKGSGRSIEAFDLHGALALCEDHLRQYGGHSHAAGVSLHADQIDGLRTKLNEVAETMLIEEDMVPKMQLDATIYENEMTLEAVHALASLAPFGQKNRPPLFLMKNVQLNADPRVVGRNHLKLNARANGSPPFEVIGFNQGDRLPDIHGHNGGLHLAGIPKVNEFRGVRTVQFEIKDLCLAEE